MFRNPVDNLITHDRVTRHGHLPMVIAVGTFGASLPEVDGPLRALAREIALSVVNEGTPAASIVVQEHLRLKRALSLAVATAGALVVEKGLHVALFMQSRPGLNAVSASGGRLEVESGSHDLAQGHDDTPSHEDEAWGSDHE